MDQKNSRNQSNRRQQHHHKNKKDTLIDLKDQLAQAEDRYNALIDERNKIQTEAAQMAKSYKKRVQELGEALEERNKTIDAMKDRAAAALKERKDLEARLLGEIAELNLSHGKQVKKLRDDNVAATASLMSMKQTAQQLRERNEALNKEIQEMTAIINSHADQEQEEMPMGETTDA
jgi:chromosome segregation ATPase